jgi:hypothetical protein
MTLVSSLGLCCREVLFGHFVRSVWSVVKKSSMAGNLSELLEETERERERARERESCGAGCLQYMLCVRSSRAGGIVLEVQQRQEALLE